MLHLNDLSRADLLEDVKGVIFDCDGVLIDSIEANSWYYNTIRKHFGLPEMDEELREYTHTRTMGESIRRIVPADRIEEAWAFRQGFDYRRVLPHIILESGLREVLNWMRCAGLRMGINTSRTDTLELVLEYFGLSEYFQPAITSFKVARIKPHPEGVFAILEAWRMKPEDVVYIGDSEVDEINAKAAGVRLWSFKNPNLDAEMMIPDFWTLLGYLRRTYGFVW